MTRKLLSVLVSLGLGLGVGCGGNDSGDGVLPGVQALVFAKRAFIDPDTGDQVLGGMGNVFDYLRYVPGGGVYVLEPPTPDGTLRSLTDGYEGVDISGLDLSFDATKVAFSMRHAGDDRYHIYVGNLDGSGVRQLTFGPNHDVKPLFVAGDQIAFVTNEPYTAMGTRADEYNHSRIVSQIATITEANGDADRRVCSQNLSHTVDLTRLSDGRIGYSRWEHFNNRNDLKFFAMNPDCTNMMAIAGEFGKRFNSFVQVQEWQPGVFVGIGTSREGTFQAGALIQADARSQTSADPNRLDVQQVSWDNLTPAVPTGEASPPSGVGRYRSPMPLPDRSGMIVSWADGDVNERLEITDTAPQFGIYRWDPDTRERVLVYDDPQFWDLYAIPVQPSEIPPVRGDTRGAEYDVTTPAVLGSVDITQTSLSESVRGGTLDGMDLSEALSHAHRVRVIEGFSAEIGAVREFGLTMAEGAAVLGEVPVYADGSWEAAVPPYLPYHLQPIDEFGLSIRNQRLWIQAMPGEERRCGGCHASRSENVLPRGGIGMTTIAQQQGPVDINMPIADRVELAWDNASYSNNAHNDMQALFDSKCTSCHDGGAQDPFAGRSYMVEYTTEEGEMGVADVPYLLLTADPIEVFYDMEVVAYPASYVTLLYPDSMMGDVTATGDVPPVWVRITDARRSRLIEAVNAESEVTPGTWAFDSPAHPEDVGVTLTREERMMLIRMVDLGGQYYSRQNVEGAGELVGREY